MIVSLQILWNEKSHAQQIRIAYSSLREALRTIGFQRHAKQYFSKINSYESANVILHLLK